MKIVLVILVVINVIAFIAYGIDKGKAIANKRRIPERTLILLAYLGGGPGALLGMLAFRHKTRKLKFRILVPLSIILYIVVIIALWKLMT